MKKRLFIAINCSEEIQLKYLKIKSKLSNLNVVWLQPSDIHTTLVPPWWENEESVYMVQKKLESLSKLLKKCQIGFGSIRYGTTPNNPRLIWAGGESNTDLSLLKNQVDREFNDKKDSRPFFPHVTLARFKNKEFVNFPIKDLDLRIKWKQNVDAISLMESLGSRREKRYRIISNHPFSN